MKTVGQGIGAMYEYIRQQEKMFSSLSTDLASHSDSLIDAGIPLTDAVEAVKHVKQYLGKAKQGYVALSVQVGGAVYYDACPLLSTLSSIAFMSLASRPSLDGVTSVYLTTLLDKKHNHWHRWTLCRLLSQRQVRRSEVLPHFQHVKTCVHTSQVLHRLQGSPSAPPDIEMLHMGFSPAFLRAIQRMNPDLDTSGDKEACSAFP